MYRRWQKLWWMEQGTLRSGRWYGWLGAAMSVFPGPKMECGIPKYVELCEHPADAAKEDVVVFMELAGRRNRWWRRVVRWALVGSRMKEL